MVSGRKLTLKGECISPIPKKLKPDFYEHITEFFFLFNHLGFVVIENGQVRPKPLSWSK